MNSQKLPFQQSLARLAQSRAKEAIGLLAMSLPASIIEVNGAVAKVKFEVLDEYNLPEIEVPISGSEYVRIPLQPGDKGILVPCEASIFGVSGMSTNVADLTTPANLSSLMFVPIGNKKWKSVDGKMLVLTGMSDVIIRDDANQLQLSDEKSSWESLIQQINQLLLVIGPLLTTPTVLTPITANTNPVKPRA